MLACKPLPKPTPEMAVPVKKPPTGGHRDATSSSTQISHLDGTPCPRLAQILARARGNLADSARSEAYFGKAVSDPARDQWPFERAQLRLDHAE